MIDLPEWLEDQLGRPNPDNKLPKRPVVGVFYTSEKPFLSRREVQMELDGNFDKSTVLKRLNSLVEDGILQASLYESMHLYWLNKDESDWPIPPDTTVSPAREELTVTEFFQSRAVTLGATGIGLGFLSNVPFMLGVYLATFKISLFGMGSPLMMALGSLLLITSLGFITGGFLWWFRYMRDSGARG